jgi:hypothetical protein
LIGVTSKVVSPESFGRQVAGAEGPGDLELAVVRRDLLQRRIALAELGAAIGAPIAIRLRVGFALCGTAGLGDRAVDVVIARTEAR